MKNAPQLPENQKLKITYRVEPGCLGPKGGSIIDEFCLFAQSNIESADSAYVLWNIVPRNDKTLAEIEFSILGKKMNRSQVEKYLIVFSKHINELEDHFENRLTSLIDEFLVR